MTKCAFSNYNVWEGYKYLTDIKHSYWVFYNDCLTGDRKALQ